MRFIINADMSYEEFSITIDGMNSQQFDSLRILLKTLCDYSPILQEADSSGLELKALMEFVTENS